MKILQLSHKVPYPLHDGGSIAIHAIAKSLADDNHDLTIWCLDAIKHNTPISKATFELKKLGKVFIHPIDTGIKPDDALKNVFESGSYNVERFYNGVFNTELAKLLQKEQFDVVHLESTFMGPYVDTVRNNHKGKIVLRMHNVEHQIWQRRAQESKNPLKKTYFSFLAKRLKKYEKELLSKVDVVVPISKDDDTIFQSLQNDIKSVVVGTGIDINEVITGPTGFYKWYHLGSMAWQPNINGVSWFINDIHQHLTALNSEYHLTLGGKQIHSFNPSTTKAITIQDTVNDASAFIQDHEVCLVPLKSGSGLRIKILEAMALKRLVISTTIGAQGLNYQKNRHLLIADTKEEFIQHLKDLQSGKISGASIIDAGFNLVKEEYSQKAQLQLLLKSYA